MVSVDSIDSPEQTTKRKKKLVDLKQLHTKLDDLAEHQNSIERFEAILERNIQNEKGEERKYNHILKKEGTT